LQPPRADRSFEASTSTDEELGTGGPYSKVYLKKATWEGTFGVPSDVEDTVVAQATGRMRPPWEAVSQLNEKNLVWSNDLQAKLLKTVVARDLGLPDSEVERRLLELQNLMPDMATKLPTMQANLVRELVRDTAAVARRLVKLKAIFPAGNVSQLGTRCPSLLLTDDKNLMELERDSERLKQELPGVDIDRLATAFPNDVLSVDTFLDAIREAKRLLPGLDIEHMLANNPTQVFSFEKGPKLIPYDDVKELWG